MNINLTCIPGAVPPVVHCTQYDNNSRSVVAAVDTTDFTGDASAATAWVYAKKPDGTIYLSKDGVSKSVYGSIATVTVVLSAQLTAAVGKANCVISFVNGTTVIGAAPFVLDVADNPYDPDGVISTDVFEGAMQDAISQYVDEHETEIFESAGTTASQMVRSVEGDYASVVPILRNGSLPNAGNANAVATKLTQEIRDTKARFIYDIELEDGQYMLWTVYAYVSIGVNTEGLSSEWYIIKQETKTETNSIDIDFTAAIAKGKKSYGASVFVMNADGTCVSQRVETNAKPIIIERYTSLEAFSELTDTVSTISGTVDELVVSRNEDYSVVVPVLRDGSLGNSANAYAVATKLTQKICDNKARVIYDIDLEDGQFIRWNVYAYDSIGVSTSSVLSESYNFVNDTDTTTNYLDVDFSTAVSSRGKKSYGVSLFVYDSDGTQIAQRVETNAKSIILERYATLEDFDGMTDTVDGISDTVDWLADVHDADNAVKVPVLRNGSLPNAGNASAVATKLTQKIAGTKAHFVYDIDLTEGQYMLWSVYTYVSVGAATTGVASEQYIICNEKKTTTNYIDIDFTAALSRGKKSYGAGVYVCDADGTVIAQRVETNAKHIVIERYASLDDLETLEESIGGSDTLTALANSRFVSGKTDTSKSALTLLHMTDLHSDSAAYARMVAKAEELGDVVDDVICTGDMVGNDSTSVFSFWTRALMTCIGNHDSAVYSSSTGYDWTALTMAERDAKYIAPFESAWGIVHTSGTSYYYKDYADAGVRMIVMDSMLYMDTDTASEASAQTAWMKSAMEGAKSLGYHILIAEHTAHGGATAVKCSFSRYGYDSSSVMPTYTDCDLPSAVVDAVAEEIAAGCIFIGYLCGHTHQDMIWDAKGDKTQLMYCATCANQYYEPQWENADLARKDINGDALDAYNMVTIDTNHTLIKIVRFGGADMDDHMRPRKQICVDYSTGTIVSE